MRTITQLITDYKEGNTTLDEVFETMPKLEWGSRKEDVDGAIWWDGENLVGDIYILWILGTINDEELDMFLEQVP